MNKKEAAEYLGVSTRSVERYMKGNRLACRYVEGKIGPRPVFDEPDLVAFKASLEAQRHREAVRVESPDAMKTIGFRLEPEFIDRLNAEAAKRGLSPRACARQLLVASLEDFRYEGILAEFSALRSALTRSGGGRNAGKDQDALLAKLTALQDDLGRLHAERPTPAPVDTHSREIAEMADGIAGLQEEMHRLRKDLVQSLEAILLNALPRSQQSEVSAWIATLKQGLRSPER